MELIQFPALNCYHACIVTLAQHFGLPCTRAFSRLWAESSLRYDPICGVFLTRRLPRALESMGMALGTPCVTPEARAAAWQSMPPDAFALAGMDAFRIPWTPLFGLQHGPHYFIVRKTGAEQALCFDPTYGLSGQMLPAEALRAGLCADRRPLSRRHPSKAARAAPHTGGGGSRTPPRAAARLSGTRIPLACGGGDALFPRKICRRAADRPRPVPPLSRGGRRLGAGAPFRL
ncbi:MAG: hypothetical protein ACLSD3_00020 [Acutalibacteraceae bacterium]